MSVCQRRLAEMLSQLAASEVKNSKGLADWWKQDQSMASTRPPGYEKSADYQPQAIIQKCVS